MATGQTCRETLPILPSRRPYPSLPNEEGLTNRQDSKEFQADCSLLLLEGSGEALFISRSKAVSLAITQREDDEGVKARFHKPESIFSH